MNMATWSESQRCERCSTSLTMGDSDRDELGRFEWVELIHPLDSTCDAVVIAYPRSNGDVRITVR